MCTRLQAMERFSLNSCVRGHHVYKNVWTPQIGETLLCQPEFGNVMDPYAVAIVTGDEVIIGHVPRKISAMCHLFLRRGGHIACQVTGHRQFSADLPQGGLEVPCSLVFVGAEKEICKVKRLSSAASDITIAVEPPEKKAKTSNQRSAAAIDISEQYDRCKASSESSVWIKVDGHLLTLSDEKDLLNNKKLNDRHINLAQRLLSKQFPDIEGLGHTLFQSKPPIKSISNGLQIVFDRENHWIVASSLSCDSHTIQVYDSLYPMVNEASKKVMLNLFEGSRRKIVQVNVQKQLGGQDCGLFAIGISTALLNNIDVTTIQFNQHEMRHHLHDCFNAGLISPFPSRKV